MRILVGLLAAAAVATAAAAVELTPAQKRGKEIYIRGTTADGAEITALMGVDQLEVPGSALPCVNCHGYDGRGRPEGGVTPTDLTWEALTRPYGIKAPSGREAPPYDRRSLKRAIALGVDSGGTELNIVMPRYRMAHEDLEALVGYIEVLSADRDPGVTDRELTLGLVLPPAATPMAPVGEVIRGVVAAWAGQVSARGGIYGRELKLAELELPADPAARPSALERFVAEREVFALVAPFFAGADAELAEVAQELEIPAIAPFTLEATEGFPVNRQVFYLWSGIAGQARALVRHASVRGEPPPAAVAEPADGRLAAATAAVAEELEQVGGAPPERLALGPPLDPVAQADRLREAGVADLYLLDSGPGGAALLTAAGKVGWHPRLLVPGSLAGGAVFQAAAGFTDQVVLAYPTLPGDRSEAALAELRRLVGGLDLPAGQDTVAITAFAGARLLAEGLERAGRAVSREKLISALEELYDHPTELTPHLTYDPNRRIGARGAYIVTLDPETGQARSAGGWVGVDQ